MLPSHHQPFVGLHARLDALARHHEERLAQTLDACRTPSTAAQVLRRLFRRELDDHQLFFAIGEALAHLHHLVARGQVTRTQEPAGPELFARVSAAG